jgi:hypothetical protein
MSRGIMQYEPEGTELPVLYRERWLRKNLNLKKGMGGQLSKNGYFWHLLNTSIDILRKFTHAFW